MDILHLTLTIAGWIGWFAVGWVAYSGLRWANNKYDIWHRKQDD